ncbi:hypothetical protein DICPUDRAFT_76094 [Dictyostelium purpureum]|uniref:Uncharacterized protein n=1 Tax=Dictyostelium purpureum TaxID=5786 RepID=F0ZCK6_DICPU|nr:uncharacterized protein DICPUDRAFT_76094 [Dictyostelium purpureum]EGC38314.1 hypothetical protein DICPUDRAFT_76094 [Dictyostelium purpureum]|eukprot:XP_003285175.1 hypothetical protein DICPUDRAFT_76094 [Dictyostelium purpureum]
MNNIQNLSWYNILISNQIIDLLICPSNNKFDQEKKQELDPNAEIKPTNNFNKNKEQNLQKEQDPTEEANVNQDLMFQFQPNKNLRNYKYNLKVQVIRKPNQEAVNAFQELQKFNIEPNEHFYLPNQSWGGKEMNFSFQIPKEVEEIIASLRMVGSPNTKAGIILKFKYSGVGDWYIGCLTAKATSGIYYLEIQHSNQTFRSQEIEFRTNSSTYVIPFYYKFSYFNNMLYIFSSFFKAEPKPKPNSTPKPLVVEYNGVEIKYDYSPIKFGQTPLYISFPAPEKFLDAGNTQNNFEIYYNV